MLFLGQRVVGSQVIKRTFNSRTFASKNLEDPVIISACRTPIGSFRKSLARCSAPYLGSIVVRGVVEKAGLEPKIIQEVFMGNVVGAYSGQAPARQAAIKGGLELSTPCTTINKVCASGMKSIMFAAQSIECGNQNVVLAGGMESMSNVPFYLPRQEPAYGGAKLIDGIVHDGLWDVYNQFHMGNCGENTACQLKISREEQDAYAVSSYERSQASAAKGVFAKEIVPVQVPPARRTDQPTTFSADEEFVKVDFTKFPKLKPAFLPADKGGTITAANASTLNDGAAACIVASASFCNRVGIKPLARIVGYADGAMAPIDFPIAPKISVDNLLKKTGINKEQVKYWEINEAFSVVALANMKLLELDPSKVNVSGGAVSIGHPIGMSGARITNHLAMCLRKGELGVASICNGGGGASAIMLEGLTD